MRKFLASLLLLATLLPFTARAEELTVYNGTTTNQYVPAYVSRFDDYTRTQHVIPATQLASMNGGLITSIQYYTNQTAAYTTASVVDVYMTEVNYTTISAFIAKESATIVYQGTLDFAANGDCVITLTTPYMYNGGNLLIGIENTTDAGYKSVKFKGQNVTGAAVSGYNANSLANVNPTVRGFIPKTTFTYGMVNTGTTITTNPAQINLGERPNNGWMPPYMFELVNSGLPGVVKSMEANAPFVAEADLPAEIGFEGTVPVGLSTLTTTTTGSVTDEFLVSYEGDRSFATFNATVNFYTAATPDIWEVAQNVTTFPYNATITANTNIHKNYNLPGSTENHKDAVYKITLANDAMISATTTGAEGVSAIYPEGFNGVGGPDAENYYEYEGPVVADGPIATWFHYDYTGNTTFTGGTGGLFFGYKIPASLIQELGYGNCSLYAVETAAYQATPYYLFIAKGDEAPEEILGAEVAEPNALSFFDIVLEEPILLGDTDDYWVLFYSTSDYPAYVGKNPVDANGVMRYSADGETWSTNSNYTPLIACQLLEISTGRQITLDLASLEMKAQGTADFTEMTANVQGVSRAQRFLEGNNVRGNRDAMVQNLYVPAGTYYVAIASTDQSFPVSITKSNVAAPEPAVVVSPADGATNVNAPVLIEWEIGNYTEEMQVLLGTQYPPTDVLIDWTDQLVNSTLVMELEHNKTYFVQVNGRNAAGVTEGIVSGFTTPIDPVDAELTVLNDKLYPGDVAEFSWAADRGFLGYNLYKDGEKVNEEPITGTEYAVEGLTYNMTGYDFQLTGLYAEGESEPTEAVKVYMTGNGIVSGTVYEQDSITPLANATVEFRGIDAYELPQTIVATADENGDYTADVYEGVYEVFAYADGFAECQYDGEITVAYEQELTGIDIYVHEFYTPLGMITATLADNNVEVEWAWGLAEKVVDFETGDFSQAEFNNESSDYPWAITTTNPYEGTYCMKSTCENVNYGVSYIEATVDVPFAAKMGFYVKVSSESSYDKFHFYIDGVEKGQALSGEVAYTYKEYTVEEGTHTYKWEYAKDVSMSSGDDCVYIDNIVLYREDVPAPPVQGATVYDFEDETMMSWTSLDADGDGYGWVSSAEPGQYHNPGVVLAGTGHNDSQGYVLSGSYSNAAGIALNPDNYLIAPTQITAANGAQISFFACAQDANYAAEHFGVAVSTTTATADAFTTIQEWTMTAKGEGRPAVATRTGNRAGNWYEYTVDLSAYAGQNIWVALRHFNCSDMFILNVDDITLADGSAKGMADRSFQHFNLYRRNNFTEEMELIATPNDTTFNYTDTQWNNLPAGEYQWGIQAYYEGNAAPARDAEVLFTDDFESGALSNWTTIDVDDDGLDWQITDPANIGLGDAHSGTYIASSWSWSSTAFDPDNYMISPMVEGAASINYFVATNAGYPDHYGIAVSSTGTDANDFTVIFDEVAPASKVANADRFVMGQQGGSRAMSPWTERTVEIPAGTKYVAFRHYNSADCNYLLIDDVTIYGEGGDEPPTPPTPPLPSDGPGMSEILWSNAIDKDMIATVTINVALNSGQAPTGATVEMVGAQTFSAVVDETGVVVFENVRKGEYALTVAMDEFVSAYNETPVTIAQNETTINVMLYEIIGNIDGLYVSTTGFAKWEGVVPGGDIPTPPTPPTPGTGNWYYYDDGECTNHVGLGGGQFYFGVMFPAGTYQGNQVTKVSAFDAAGYTMTGSVTIYNGGDSAPGTAVGNMNVAFVGADDFTEFTFPTPVTIDPSQNLWVIFDNESGDDYPASCSADVTNDPNGRWIGLNGSWYDMATIGVPGATLMVRAYVAGSAKGEVTELSIPTKNYPGDKLVAVAQNNKGNRAPLVYKLMLDGVYAGETAYPGFQFDVEGLEEGSEHVASVLPVYATGEGEWAEFTWTYTPCDNWAGLTEEPTAAWQGQDVVLNWVLPEGGDVPPTPPTPPTPGEGDWYYYDDGTYGTSIGTNGGTFSWAVMFPAGSYEGNMVTKVSAHNSAGYAMNGTVTIYNDGASAPSNPVGEMNITFPGADDFTEFEFAEPVVVDPTKNIWVVFYNASGATYPADASAGSDLNGQWVSLDGVDWMDVGTAGVPGYVWMIRAYIANGAKGEVTEISVPQRPHDGGQLAAVKATRDDQTFDFEDGTMQGWTTIDADNDGFNWAASTAFGGNNGSTGIVYSQSYDNNYGVLYPDNYLVCPAKGQYGSITFYACAQDNGYAAEHFGVAVSTGSNTSAADFTTVQEWTLSAKSVGAPTTATRSGNRTQGNWYEYTVDLSAYAGQDIWVALRHFNCSDMFYIDVDDITLSGEGSGPVPPVPPTPGESAVLGAAIFRNGDCIAEVMAPEMTYTDVNPGEAAEYEIRVIYDGEKFAADTLGGGYIGTYYAMSCPLSCYPGDLSCDAPENLAGEYVWDNGTFGAQISWTYGEAPSSDIDIDFEDASMGNWTTIDADNDGYNWMVGTAFGGHNGSTGIVYSQSYDNTVGALTPDNYFVSPQTPLGGSFSFWACAQDNAWAAEHFGVAVSTAGNTSASDFTTVQEWTMTAKSNGRPNSVRGEREQGTWYQYTVDLSSYAGQMGYIAIRHFNSTDWFYLDVDDITYTLAKRAGDPVNFAVYRNGSQIATVPCTGAYSYTYFDNVAAGNYEYQVKALYEDCESDFALTATGQNYVTVNVTAVGEISDMISVYPNPTNGNVTIEAAGMNRITVVSALGQVVYDAAVNADNYQMNLGQFKAGIYMVRISTESGVSVKRVTVVE